MSEQQAGGARDAEADLAATGKTVIYWLDNGEFILATLLKDAGGSGQLMLDLRNEPASKYVGAQNWFATDYVKAHDGIVPDWADYGEKPGQWQFIEPAIAELATARAERDHHKQQEARAWADADLARRERDEWFAAKVNADAELAAARAGREAVKPSTQGDTHAD